MAASICRDHNATSYSTETDTDGGRALAVAAAEIITLRAIALKLKKLFKK